MTPISSHTTSSQNGDPSERAMPAGVRNIPIATTSPTTSAVTVRTPSWRRNGIGGEVARDATGNLSSASLSGAASLRRPGDSALPRGRWSAANQVADPRGGGGTEHPQDEVEHIPHRGKHKYAHRQADKRTQRSQRDLENQQRNDRE